MHMRMPTEKDRHRETETSAYAQIACFSRQVYKQHAISQITVYDLFLTAGSREDGLQSGKHNEIGRNTKADRQTQAWPGRQRQRSRHSQAEYSQAGKGREADTVRQAGSQTSKQVKTQPGRQSRVDRVRQAESGRQIEEGIYSQAGRQTQSRKQSHADRVKKAGSCRQSQTGRARQAHRQTGRVRQAHSQLGLGRPSDNNNNKGDRENGSDNLSRLV